MADAQVLVAQPTSALSIHQRPADSLNASNMAASNSNRTTGVFEFTKRKKWADLLVTELAGTIILVLSNSGEVLYCGAAAVELLGWREEEVIDTELTSWMHEDDAAPFIAHFDGCVASHTEMSTFARLRGKANGDARWPVFELRGHPHYDQDQCACFFVMARPYPSRNTAMLDSFLELKIENERLRRRLVDLRPSASSYPPPPYISGAAISNARGGGPDIVFTTDPLQGIALNVNPAGIYGSTGLSVPRAYQSHYFAGPPLKSSATSTVAPEEISPVNDHFTYRSASSAPSGVGRPRAREVDEAETSGNDAPKKKKVRKSTAPAYGSTAEDAPAVSSGPASGGNTASSKAGNAPQYVCVTCGRTDSPEWRKGPMGAKTLCNACGLRWAKRNQKKKAETAAAAAAEDDDSTAVPVTKDSNSKTQETEESSADKA